MRSNGTTQARGIVRSRWAAIGAAVAVTLGAGGLASVRAASAESVLVPITPQRVLDTRSDVGLSGRFTGGVARNLDVTGSIPVVGSGGTPSTAVVVPDGATAIVANVTAVRPTSTGYVSVRPGDATGLPTTSSVNIPAAGGQYPNAVTVALPTSGADAGTVDLYYFADQAGGTTHMLFDIVGYYVEGGSVPGPKGDTGDTGPRGVSSWDTIPSGQMLTGLVVYDNQVAASGSSDDVYIPFGALAPVGLSSTDVNFQVMSSGGQFADADATCTGTLAAPTAPSGKVCIYVNSVGGVARSTSGGQSSVFLAGQHGFIVHVEPDGGATAGDDMYLFGTWAYTAP